jgi:hypothetical protein
VVFDFEREREREREKERASERGQREEGRVSERGWGRTDRGEREDFFEIGEFFLKFE